jgi:hypothetical protein
LIRVNEENAPMGLAEILAGSSRSGEAVQKGACEGEGHGEQPGFVTTVRQADPSPPALAQVGLNAEERRRRYLQGNRQVKKETGHGRNRH